MQINRTATALAVALLVAPLAVMAQDSATETAIGLTVENGSVLVSAGGEFVQATPGQVLQAGQRVLVAEGASASLTYGGGCQTPLSQPGVYTVSATCNVAGTPTGESAATGSTTAATSGPATGAGATTGTAIGTGTIVAGVIGGVAVIAALAGGGGSDDPPPPPAPPPPPPISR